MQNGVAQWFENFPIRMMMDVAGDSAGINATVQQFNGIDYGKNNPAQQWTPTLSTAAATYTLVSGGNTNHLENSNGVTIMGAVNTGSWSQQWFAIEFAGTSIIACADGTGCLTANSNGQNSQQLHVEPYTGLPTQFWGSSAVSTGRYPPPVTLLPAPALQTFLGSDTTVPRGMSPGTYQLGDLLCEIQRRANVAKTANHMTDATYASIVEYIDFWLTDYDGSYNASTALTNIEAAGTASSTAVTEQDWDVVKGDLNDDDFIPPGPLVPKKRRG